MGGGAVCLGAALLLLGRVGLAAGYLLGWEGRLVLWIRV